MIDLLPRSFRDAITQPRAGVRESRGSPRKSDRNEKILSQYLATGSRHRSMRTLAADNELSHQRIRQIINAELRRRARSAAAEI